jgi:hypothetical protein
LALSAVALTACGDKTSTIPTTPTVVIAPTVTAVSPTTGATLGGTTVTISGLNFAAGAVVTIGGVAATSATVVSSTTITAVAGAHAAGAADVVVIQGDQSSTLAAAFTYVTLPPPTVSSVFPSAGSSAGGTTVTITGTNFAPGATVTVGGVAATSVAVVNLTSLTAVTGAHATGSADVMVTVGGQSGTLARAFTYLVPGQNLPPVITSVKIQSAQPNAPADFADLNESVPVTAIVTDAETPVSQLTLEWSADLGTITGTGTAVTWRMPATATTPRAATITLKVVEALGTSGGSQSTTAKATLSLHDSIKEIGSMSRQFLLDFSDSALTPSYVVRDFYDGCSGKAAELSDVTDNRAYYTIRSFTIGQPTNVSVGFKAGCVVPNRGTRAGDGCAIIQCEWHDTYKPTGALGTSIGPDYLTAVYRNDRWWLCNSDWPTGTRTSPFGAVAVPFIR